MNTSEERAPSWPRLEENPLSECVMRKCFLLMHGSGSIFLLMYDETLQVHLCNFELSNSFISLCETRLVFPAGPAVYTEHVVFGERPTPLASLDSANRFDN